MCREQKQQQRKVKQTEYEIKEPSIRSLQRRNSNALSPR